MSNAIRSKYGHDWPEGTTDLDIELAMLADPELESPEPHYLAIDRLLWPDDDQHRWATLAFETFSENTISVLMGPSDSGKTYPAAKWALMEYWTDPDHTLVLMSSTDVRGLELRVWGEMTELFNRAKEKFPLLPGVILEGKRSITTDESANRGTKKPRTLRKGIICIPCLQDGKFVGLGKYVGIKQKRLRQVADECQLMGASFLNAVPNFLGKDYKGVFLGNPLDPMDPLGRIAEPEEGWANHPEPEATTTWKTRLYDGTCVNFVGTDSPNFDFPRTQKVKYPYMISWKKIDQVAAFWGKDSIEYCSQCVGVLKVGLVGNRVITVQLCQEHGADAEAVWQGTDRTRIYGIDPAYGGGARCVGGWVEFGRDPHGRMILRVNAPRVYPVRPGVSMKPEKQIALELQKDLVAAEIPPKQAFYDAFGKGTIGASFAEVFGAESPVPIDTGGKPSRRPVRHDLYVWDEALGAKRLKRCDEHYSKFITEMWFSARYVIECGQMRELPPEVRNEGCMREYGIVHGNRLELEQKKHTLKRMGVSPDLFDWLTVCIEGARQHGFEIDSGIVLIQNALAEDKELSKAANHYRKVMKRAMLIH